MPGKSKRLKLCGLVSVCFVHADADSFDVNEFVLGTTAVGMVCGLDTRLASYEEVLLDNYKDERGITLKADDGLNHFESSLLVLIRSKCSMCGQ